MSDKTPRVFHSIEEVERHYFPNYHRENLETKAAQGDKDAIKELVDIWVSEVFKNVSIA